MRTRRSLTAALALTVALTATTLSAATRDTASGRSSQPQRPSIISIVKRILHDIIRAVPEPSVPIPGPTNS